MSSSKQNISIRFEVDIPVGVAVNVQGGRGEPERPGPCGERHLAVEGGDPGCPTTNPASGTTAVVRPVTTSALAFLCAQATFSLAVSVVSAKVYVDLDATIPASPPGSATLGQSPDSGVTWSWNDANNLPNPLPGVNHIPTGVYPQNKLVIWYKPLNATVYSAFCSTTFCGQTGSPSVPCGSGTGSGPGRLLASALHSTFPATWSVEMKGFEGPRAGWNNSFALRSPHAPGGFTWTNAGDGEHSPRVELSFCTQRREWTLTVHLGRERLAVTATAHAPFAPLVFQVGAEQGGPSRHGAPEILASPI